MSNSAYDSEPAIPNKLLKEDGTITDLTGQEVGAQVDAYRLKPAIPDKVLNADGTYSKLSDIIGGGGNIDLYVIVDELPASGDLQKIYLVPNGSGGFDEYRWTGTKWDPIGMLEFDLTDYSTTEQMNEAIADSLQDAKDYSDTNFLKKNNTTAFTPSGDYNPATKKYVDDSTSGAIEGITVNGVAQTITNKVANLIIEGNGVKPLDGPNEYVWSLEDGIYQPSTSINMYFGHPDSPQGYGPANVYNPLDLIFITSVSLDGSSYKSFFIIDNIPGAEGHISMGYSGRYSWNMHNFWLNKNYEETTNRVTSISSSSTNTQYPTAKAVYDAISNTVTDALNDDY